MHCARQERLECINRSMYKASEQSGGKRNVKWMEDREREKEKERGSEQLNLNSSRNRWLEGEEIKKEREKENLESNGTRNAL